MKCELRKDKYLLVANGSPKENAALGAIIDLMQKANLSDDDANDFGICFDNGIAKTFVYLPEFLHKKKMVGDYKYFDNDPDISKEATDIVRSNIAKTLDNENS